MELLSRANKKKWGGYIIIILGFILASFVAGIYLPEGIDWKLTYRPAALALLDAKSPFSVDIYFAAPWAAFFIIPYAVMPEWIGRGFMFMTGLAVFAITAKKLGAKPIAFTAFLLSPPVWHCLLNSNIEWMPLLGYVLPPKIGLFLIPIKPQIGLGAAIYWFIEAYRKGKWTEVIRVYTFPTLLLGISFIVFGFWPLRFSDTLTMTAEYNQSLFPMSIPVGLGLLVYAIRSRNIRFAMASSPCLSPYVLLHAWTGAVAAILTDDLVTVAVVVGLWFVMILRII